MSKAAIIGVMMFVMLSGNLVRADDCEIVNGSFEDDRRIDDITMEDPNGWDVSVQSEWFAGKVLKEGDERAWVTEGDFNLELFTTRYKTFDVNDMIKLSQQLDLTEVNDISFDIYLDTYPVTKKWNPVECTAVLLIDEDVVWESNSVGSDARGPYLDQVYDVNDKYRDGELHTLSLGMRVNVGVKVNTAYITYWDFVRCAFREYRDFPRGDINLDYLVDMNDMVVVAELWLEEVDPNAVSNLSGEGDLLGFGNINFMDFAFLAGDWEGGFTQVKSLADKWLGAVEPNDVDNLFHEDDVDPNGVIDFFDFAELAEILKDSG